MLRRLAPPILLAALLAAGCGGASTGAADGGPAADAAPARDGARRDGAGRDVGLDGARVADGAVGLAARAEAALRAELSRQGLVGIAGSIARDGKVVWAGGAGYEDREAKVTVDPDRTLFRWASISKTVTGVLAAQLALEKKLDLDRGIARYVSGYAVPATFALRCKGATISFCGGRYTCKAGYYRGTIPATARTITARLLGGHLAGIMHYSNGEGSPVPPAAMIADPRTNTGIRWALAYFTKKPLVAVPGRCYSYSTFGFNLLGAVLEGAAGKPFAALVAERIARPAGAATLQPDYEWKKLPRRAVGYRRILGVTIREGSTDVSWKLPGGGLISSARDMGRYCAALMGDRLLTAAGKKIAWTRQKTTRGTTTGYGLGFGVATVSGRRRISHSGSQEKTRTCLLLYPDDRLCVTLMSNTAHADPCAAARALEKAARGG